MHLNAQAVRWFARVLCVLEHQCAILQSLQALKSEKVMEADVQDLRSKLDIAAEALRKAEERALAGQFALEVMHEIRNPLEAVGYLMHLASQEDDQTVAREHLRQANEQMATVHQIAAQTLGFARMLPTPQEVDLIELTEAALRIHHRRITAQKIHLVRDFSTKGLRRDLHGRDSPGHFKPVIKLSGRTSRRRHDLTSTAQTWISGPVACCG
jgi:signal transduction histidine kinase